MWTQKAKILLFGVVSFYVIALVNESFVLYAACSAGVALLGICYLLARRSLHGLHCRRTVLLDRLVEAGTLPVRVTVTNGGGRPRREVAVTDAMRNLTSGTARREYELLVPEVPANGDAVGNGEYLCAERGRYCVGPVILHGGDPLGMFEVQRQFDILDTVVAYPRTFDMPAGLLRGGSPLNVQDARRAPARGQGHEFYGIREYVEGDDLRWVHWKTTAHLGRLTIKEFESGAAASLTIVLDLSQTGKYGVGPNSTVDCAARIASSVARDSMLRGGFVRLCGHAKSPISTPLERGDAHLHRILEILAEVDATGQMPLPALVAAEQANIPAGSEAVLITAVPDGALTQYLLPLLDKNVGVAVVLLAAHTFDAPPSKSSDQQDGSSRLQSLLRRLFATARSPEPHGSQSEAVPPASRGPRYAPEAYGDLAQRLRALGVRVAIVESGADLPLALASILRWQGSGPQRRRSPVRGTVAQMAGHGMQKPN